MIEEIIKFQRTTKPKYKFSILIPSWNNLDFLKVCVNSIQKNSYYEPQIIIIVNEGHKKTIEWLEKKKEIDYVYSSQNIGVCYALNVARSLIKSEYVAYVNDDMYLLPNWDLELFKEIDKIGDNKFMFSSTLIEPIYTKNQCVIVKNYGRNLEDFNEDLLLKEYTSLFTEDWNGSTWPPNIVHLDMWDLVGGLSIEYSPGMYSDPDFSRKLFEVGVRIFKGKGTSLAYHFGSKSTRRVKRNNGRKTFLLKWGITSRTFTREYLNIGKGYSGKASSPELSRMTILLNRFKRMLSIL